MGLRPLEIFYSFSAGIDFRRQILTYKDDPSTVRVNVKPPHARRLLVCGVGVCVCVTAAYSTK